MLQLNNVSAGYGDLKVLKNVSVRVDQSEIVAILGSNGAGKSTLMRVISGFIKSTAGSIIFSNADITKYQSHQIVDLGIVQVPENRELFPEMTVCENLNLGSFSKRVRPNRKTNLEHVYNLFPLLSERRSQHAGSLSGGEQQMLAIGRALMASPKLLILDEPSLGLSPLYVERIFTIISDIRSEGISILIVEQNAYETIQICDRGYVIENGEMVISGSGEQLAKESKVQEAYLGV